MPTAILIQVWYFAMATPQLQSSAIGYFDTGWQFRGVWTRNLFLPRPEVAAFIDWSDRLVDMRAIQASDAKTHLPQLLDEVERGETLLITRHGRSIARIVPEPDQRRSQVIEAVERLQARRRRMSSIGAEELLAARNEGRKG
ncbi:MAG: type II toxin-antitoxin system Phd/YefM family antitoxin [Acidobacteriaceae bacterium]